MSAPKIIAQVVLVGSQILGKALHQAYRQAVRNVQGNGAAGAAGGSAASSAMDRISRQHAMTLSEAADILNVNKNSLTEDAELKKMLKNFDTLFKANEPIRDGKPHSSHYLQSKVVRAKERIEAEVMPAAEPAEKPSEK